MTTAKTKSNEIHISRIYDAPVKAVWDAWTDPDQVGKWWGPRGFTLTTKSKDIRPGGSWVYTMHSPDGVDWPNNTVYHEVEKYAKLVYDHGGTENSPPMFRVTALFSEVNGKTKLEMTMALPTPEAAAEARVFIKKAGGNTTWDRLAEHLAEANGKEIFVINRSFDAPLDLMFDMWTKPEHFSKWLPPIGMTMKFLRADIKAGGEGFYAMEGGDGLKMYGKVKYILIQKPDTLVYTQQFSDEMENITRHPLAPTWPETMLTTVKLTEEGPDRTRVTLTWEAYGKVTPEELATFASAKAGMTMGWTGSFDKLEDLIGNP